MRSGKGPTHSFVVEPLMQSEEVFKMSFSKRAPMTSKKYSMPLNRLNYLHQPSMNDTTEISQHDLESP